MLLLFVCERIGKTCALIILNTVLKKSQLGCLWTITMSLLQYLKCPVFQTRRLIWGGGVVWGAPSYWDAGGGAVCIHKHCGFNPIMNPAAVRSPERRRRLPALLFGVWACVSGGRSLWLLYWRVQVYSGTGWYPVGEPYRLAKLAHRVSTT